MNFECKRCGHCCITIGMCGDATEADVKKWKDAERDDILVWISFTGAGYDIWFNPVTEEDVDECPWIIRENGKVSCEIQDVKPEMCANFPLSKEHAKATKCPGTFKEV